MYDAIHTWCYLFTWYKYLLFMARLSVFPQAEHHSTPRMFCRVFVFVLRLAPVPATSHPLRIPPVRPPIDPSIHLIIIIHASVGWFLRFSHVTGEYSCLVPGNLHPRVYSLHKQLGAPGIESILFFRHCFRK